MHVICMLCPEMNLRPTVKVSKFKQAAPLGFCSIDSYKQDLRKCCCACPTAGLTTKTYDQVQRA